MKGGGRAGLRGIARAVTALAIAASIAAGCGERRDDGTTPLGAPSLPALTIREDTPNLLLTWIDDRGDTHSAQRPSEVPREGRSLVRVVVADREEGTRDPLYVVDLGAPSGDGAFTARAMARREWEAVIEKKRDAYLGKIAPRTAAPLASGAPSAEPTAPSASASSAASGLVVIIYGAAWCKPCHHAADYLKSKGIQVIVKDIEESAEAATEMNQKLEKSGRRGGSIPVIDVRGQILVGYSRPELDRALAKATSGTVL